MFPKDCSGNGEFNLFHKSKSTNAITFVGGVVIVNSSSWSLNPLYPANRAPKIIEDNHTTSKRDGVSKDDLFSLAFFFLSEAIFLPSKVNSNRRTL